MNEIKVESEKNNYSASISKKPKLTKESYILIEEREDDITLTPENYTKEECEAFVKELDDIEEDMDAGNYTEMTIEELEKMLGV